MVNQAFEFVELSALMTSHYHLVLDETNAPSSKDIERYWTSSKCRFNRWAKYLKRMEVIQRENQPDLVEFLWHRIQPTLMEILVSEILTRVNTAVAMIHSQRAGGDKDWIAVSESIFSGHQEIRQRTLRIMLADLPPPEPVRRDVERLRRQVERWNDLFLGFLAIHSPMDAFAFSPQRVEDFADGFRYDKDSPSYSWPRLQKGLQRAFSSRRICHLPNSELNDQIMSSLFGLISGVESQTQFSTLWRMRMSHAADRADSMISELLGDFDSNGLGDFNDLGEISAGTNRA